MPAGVKASQGAKTDMDRAHAAAARANFGPIKATIIEGQIAADAPANSKEDHQTRVGLDQDVVINLNVVPTKEGEYKEPEYDGEGEPMDVDKDNDRYIQEEVDNKAYASKDLVEWEDEGVGENPETNGGVGRTLMKRAKEGQRS